eukprot:sb/3469799/
MFVLPDTSPDLSHSLSLSLAISLSLSLSFSLSLFLFLSLSLHASLKEHEKAKKLEILYTATNRENTELIKTNAPQGPVLNEDQFFDAIEETLEKMDNLDKNLECLEIVKKKEDSLGSDSAGDKKNHRMYSQVSCQSCNIEVEQGSCCNGGEEQGSYISNVGEGGSPYSCGEEEWFESADEELITESVRAVTDSVSDQVVTDSVTDSVTDQHRSDTPTGKV